MMDDVRQLLDRQLGMLGRAVLGHGGQVAATDAKRHAERQYALYAADRKSERQTAADQAIVALRAVDTDLPGRGRRAR